MFNLHWAVFVCCNWLCKRQQGLVSMTARSGQQCFIRTGSHCSNSALSEATSRSSPIVVTTARLNVRLSLVGGTYAQGSQTHRTQSPIPRRYFADMGATACPYLHIQNIFCIQLCEVRVLGSDAPCHVARMGLEDHVLISTTSTPSVTEPTALAAIITQFAQANRPRPQALEISILMPVGAESRPCQAGS